MNWRSVARFELKSQPTGRASLAEFWSEELALWLSVSPIEVREAVRSKEDRCGTSADEADDRAIQRSRGPHDAAAVRTMAGRLGVFVACHRGDREVHQSNCVTQLVEQRQLFGDGTLRRFRARPAKNGDDPCPLNVQGAGRDHACGDLVVAFEEEDVKLGELSGFHHVSRTFGELEKLVVAVRSWGRGTNDCYVL